MFICNVWPRKTWHPLAFGTIVEALGITLLAAAVGWDHLPTVYGMLALTGVGTGIRYMPGTLHGVGYYRKHIASIVSMVQLSIALGSTLASTIMLNIFNNEMANAGIHLNAGSSTSSLSGINKLPKAKLEYLRSHAKDSISIAFHGISSFMWLGVIVMVFMGNVNINKKGAITDTNAEGETEVGSLTKGSYLGSLFHRIQHDSRQMEEGKQ